MDFSSHRHALFSCLTDRLQALVQVPNDTLQADLVILTFESELSHRAYQLELLIDLGSSLAIVQNQRIQRTGFAWSCTDDFHAGHS